MRSEMCEEVIRPQQIATETLSVEKQQEQELMARLASNGRIAPKPKSVFLQKKLQHHRKFFDSGDYAMNKDKAKNPGTAPASSLPIHISAQPAVPTTPVAPATELNVEVATHDESLQIPRPDNVPQRKASIIYPSVHSKLSPQPHIHHEKHDEAMSEQ
uniref:Regulator of atp-sensitive k+ channels alpha-endosulfine/arpp-19 n=1 Tax=Syphacia muris TaxID=451379 RepID=A0A0N5ANK1_9BILA